MAFTHLHLHSEYSLLDGAARIKDVVSRAKELGMTAIGITDHGNMFGVINFYQECRTQKIKPILGCEVYTARRDRFSKDAARDGTQGHLVLLAYNNIGYKNLMKIVSAGFLEGFYYKPRVDKELLRENSEGIIALSACLAGDITSKLLYGDYAGAKKEAIELIEIFGKENFFIEIQDHGLEEQALTNPELIKLSKELGVGLVATNDVHYVKKEDAEAQDLLLCIQTAKTIDDADRMRFPNDEFYLKSEDEMRKLFINIPEACDNTALIADRCNVEIDFKSLHLPDFQSPEGYSNNEYLRKLCGQGLSERYFLNQQVSDERKDFLEERLEMELSVIEKMGYVEYFLVVWDFIDYAKKNGIMVGTGRGSAAGSIVSYVLKITDIDPIEYNLIFERFLNPERVSMPDIDIDFCIERRQEVIDYVKGKYGEDKVALIITFGTLAARAGIRDVGRALNISYAEVDAVAKAVPEAPGMTIGKALAMSPDLKKKYDYEENARKMIDLALALEGIPKNSSTHAAGVVISKEPISEYVPLYNGGKGTATQFTMSTIEELGLLKMDFLGLRNLTIIRNTIELVEKSQGKKIDLENLELNDSETYKTISDGNTQGIFQLESQGMTQFMKNLKPNCIEDIIAGISLYRPGPMDYIPSYIENKKNPEGIRYLHESLKPILEVTYGCIVYQEQVMQIVRELAGYSYGRSDLMRRAMGKKKMDVMLKEKENFIFGLPEEGVDGCVKRGVPKHIAEEIFNNMVSFAEYAFNKSHAAAYAVIGYQTAYLKTHYPCEFMAALMTSVMGRPEKVAMYIRNAKEMGIEVLPPDVNESELGFSAKNGKIRFGLKGIKGVGENSIISIIEKRNKDGRSKDLAQFISNLDTKTTNKKSLESLIKAGALDSLNPNRAQSLVVYEKLLESAQNVNKKNVEGQISMFQLNSDVMEDVSASVNMPDISPFTDQILGLMEKEMTGIYITAHPLDKYKEEMNNLATLYAEDIMDNLDDEETVENEISIINNSSEGKHRDGDKAVILGIINKVKTIITKNNRTMAFLEVEDLTGIMEVIVFYRTYEQYQSQIKEDSVVIITGTVSMKGDEAPKVLANEIGGLDEISQRNLIKENKGKEYNIKADKNVGRHDEKFTSRKNIERSINLEGAVEQQEPMPLVKIKIDDERNFETVRNILQENKGDVQVILYLPNKKTLMANKEMNVNPTEEFLHKLSKLLGRENIKVENL